MSGCSDTDTVITVRTWVWTHQVKVTPYLHNFIHNLRDGELLLLDDQVLDALHDEARPLVDERAEHVERRRRGGGLFRTARCRVAVGHGPG